MAFTNNILVCSADNLLHEENWACARANEQNLNIFTGLYGLKTPESLIPKTLVDLIIRSPILVDYTFLLRQETPVSFAVKKTPLFGVTIPTCLTVSETLKRLLTQLVDSDLQCSCARGPPPDNLCPLAKDCICPDQDCDVSHHRRMTLEEEREYGEYNSDQESVSSYCYSDTRSLHFSDSGTDSAYESEGLSDWMKIPSIPISVKSTFDDGSQELVGKLLDTLEGFKPSKIAGATNSFLDSGGKLIKKIVVGLVFLSCSYMALEHKSKKWLSAAVLSGFLLDFVDDGATKTIVSSTIDMIRSKIDPLVKSVSTKFNLSAFEVPEPEIIYEGEGLEDFSSGFVTLSFSLFSLLCLNKTPPQKLLEKFMDMVPKFPRVMDGIGPILAALSDLCVSALNAIHEWFTGDEGPWIPKSSDITVVDNWALSVMAFKNEFESPTFLYTVENQARCENLIDQGYKLMKMEMTGVAVHKFRRFVTEYMRLLKTILEKIVSLTPDRSAFRTQPVCIMIRGEPGTGKTWFVQQFAAALLAHTIPKERARMLRGDWKQCIYMRTPENKFWEDYKGEPVTIVDDFGQLRDTPGGDVQEWMEVIRMVNNFPYVLHMAELENKGNTFFKSKIVILTSNLDKEHAPNTIHSVPAVQRRMAIDITNGIAFKYAQADENGSIPSDRTKRRIDPSKVNGFNRGVYETVTTFRRGGNETKAVVGFDELVQYTLKCLEKEEKAASRYMQDLGASIDAILEARFGKDDELFMEPIDGYESEALPIDGGEQEPLDFMGVNPCRLELSIPPVREYCNRLERNLVGSLRNLDFGMAERRWVTELLGYRDNGIESNAAACLALIQTMADTNVSLFRNMTPNQFCNILAEWDGGENTMPPAAEQIVCSMGRIYLKPSAIGTFSNSFMDFVRERELEHVNFEKSSWDQWLDSAKEKYEYFTNNNGISKTILAVIGWVGMVAAAVKLYHVFSDWGLEKKIEEPKPNREVFDAEGEPDANGTQIGIKVAHRNLYSFHWTAEGPIAGYLLVIGGRVGIIPHHYKLMAQEYIKQGREPDHVCTLKSVKTGVKHDLPMSKILNLSQTEKLKSLDVGGIMLPATMHSHPDLVRNWVTKDQLRPFASIKVGLWRMHEDSLIRDSGMAVIRSSTTPVTIRSGETSYEVNRVLDYKDIETSKGFCGAPLVANMASFGPGKILGLHIAGHATHGSIGTLILRDELEELLKLPEFIESIPAPISLDEEYDEDINPHKIKLEYESQMSAPYGAPAMIYGEVERSRAPYLPRDTSIRSSPLLGAWGPPKTAPADLTNKEYCKTAILKFFREPRLEVDLSIFEKAAYAYGAFLLQHKTRRRRASLVFDFESACVGSPAVPFFEAIPRNTSAGYPHNVNRLKLSGKKTFFGTDEKYDLSGSEAVKLKARVMKIIELAKQGKRSLHIYTDVFKDERLPLGKGKIRAFSASPLELTIAIRMYFMDFTMFMMECRTDVFCGPGMNPNSVDWDRLVHSLKSKGDKIIAGDYSAFDARHIAQIMRFLLIIIEIFYDGTDEEKLVRKVLFEEVVNSIHILGRKIYQWPGSLPSGSALTTFVNCLLNIIYMMVAFVSLVKGSKFEDFFSKVYLCVFGDDNILSVDDSIAEEFNGQTIQAFMPKINQEYTAEDKSTEMYKWKTLEEASFLKRGFRKEPVFNRWVAPLAIASVDETPYWYRKTPDPHMTIESNVDWMFMEYSLHGKEVFDKIVAERCPIIEERLGYRSPLSLNWLHTVEKALGREDHF